MQREIFSEEVSLLNYNEANMKKQKLPKNSSLYKLRPYLDTTGLLRMRGRIDACEFVEECTKRPILLPRQHYVTWLIIADIHQRHCHVNHQTTLNEIRRRFYVPQLRATYNKVKSNCQFCKNRTAKPLAPIMADLPKTRLQPFCRPFSFVGVDYFGPMLVLVGRRHEKRWGVIITCMTVRAIHIEVAHSLTTDSCILALRNFIARRGSPLRICSDRGTNFIGAEKELKQAFSKINQDELMRYFTTPETDWTFNPPASPHFGGAWERLIQSIKKSLRNIQQTRVPTDEILKNMLVEIELIINSRPLTELPLEDEFSDVLTPNHFLLGSSNGSKPLVPFDNSVCALKNNWRLSQIYANQFWNKWVSDYLPNLIRTTKWYEDTKPLQEGDVVIIVDNTLPRNCWPKGRVLKVYRSKDNKIRRALVQTPNGLLERPTVKLAVLDVGAETTSNREFQLEVAGESVATSGSSAPIN